VRILLTNDDGFEAPGLRLLERVAATLSDDVWTVAPDQEQSGASRALTLSMPVRVRERGEHRFSVAGTPTDCVRIAVLDLMAEGRPDLILSGINRGQNVGEDLGLSGTVAAAVQGAALGVRSMALSQAIGSFEYGYQEDWSSSTNLAADLITQLLSEPLPASSVMNINFPACRSKDVAGIAITRQGFHEQSCAKVERRTAPRGGVYFWMCFHEAMPLPETAGTDVAALHDAYVSVTPLLTDLTDHGVAERLGSYALGPPSKAKPRRSAPETRARTP